jgi:hypothetical protein
LSSALSVSSSSNLMPAPFGRDFIDYGMFLEPIPKLKDYPQGIA